MTQSNETTERLNKAESARINGSKSHGATSDSGKRNSANANLRHGAYSKRILLDNEVAEFYENFKLSFINHFRPQDPNEFHCVDSMITAAWRIRRLESSETRLLNIALASNKASIENTFAEPIDPPHERALAVEAKIASLESLTRIQERLHRIYDRNFKLLVATRKKSGGQVPQPLPASLPPETETVSQPVPESPKPAEQTIDPTESETPGKPAASIITQIALFLVIFALLLLTPAPVKAVVPQFQHETPAIHAARTAKTSLQLHFRKEGTIK